MLRHHLLAAIALLLSASPARAQWADAGRLRSAAHPPVTTRVASLERPPGAEAAKALPGQYVAGLAGGAVGLVGGTLLGVLAAWGSGDAHDTEAMILVPAFVGWMGGTTYGIHAFSRVKGTPGRPLAALGGAVLGLLGGPVAIATVPLGAQWAYNRTRTAPPR